MSNDKKVKLEFAPGCFDSFEGTQEELDALMQEMQEMFDNMTPEEIEARSVPFDLDSFVEDLDPDQVEKLINALSDDYQRKLQ